MTTLFERRSTRFQILVQRRSKSRQNVNGLRVFVSLRVIEYIIKAGSSFYTGGVAQMVERSLSMREVPGSIPGASTESF